MTLILNQTDLDELYEQFPQPQPDDLVLDEYEKFVSIIPRVLGREVGRVMELLPGVRLDLSDYECSQDWMFREPAHPHPIQLLICLSGFVHCDLHPSFGGTCGYFSGSGISPAYVETNRSGDRVTSINIEIEPDVLESLFLGDRQRHSESIQQLFKGEDYKVSVYPTVTAKMRSLAEQIWNAPYQGAMRRMYLQAKVFELLVMQLDWLGVGRQQSDQLSMRTTRDRIYHARDILLADLEQSPSVLELAQQVGVSVGTLQRQFRAVFGTTVFGYLTDQRMKQAEQLLRQRHYSVTEIAAVVGYSNPGHFAAAFKRKFGITPYECLLGKTIVSRSFGDRFGVDTAVNTPLN
jgi:AraC-like DNA-binding protein